LHELYKWALECKLNHREILNKFCLFHASMNFISPFDPE
jgi:hypothetical protein